MDENEYYKYYDITDRNQRDVTGILKRMKSKFKQLKLKTYDITFDNSKHDYVNNVGSTWWKVSIYDNNEKEVLKV